MAAHDENTKKYKILNLGILLLGSILFIVVYTFILQRNYSYNTLKTEVENDVSRSDAIYETICNNLTKEDYTEINDVSDMETERYQALQKRLNEVRRMKSARYLYTAKRAEDGSLVYLVDGLDLGAEDFAYPGTLIEEEVLPYLEAALNGETTYSQKIMDTTWGHIFTACYPVHDQNGSGDIIGALCIEVDMEETYKAIEADNSSAGKIAMVAAALAVLLIFWGYDTFQKSKQKELDQQRQLEKIAEAAEAANKAKSTFLFNMSHDIRTPMNAILGYTDLARKYADDPEKLNKYMDNIHTSGERLLSIINDVLELARIENNETKIEESVSHAGDGLDACVVMLKSAAEDKHQEVMVKKEIDHPYVYLDLPHMSEVVLNILSNAIKYTGDGGRIQCTMKQLPHENEGWCMTEIAIEDNGIGISEDFQKHIFEAFSRERSSTVSGIDGTGLGMGIVKKLVDLMNGTVQVESELGKGSKFTVQIPLRIASAEDMEKKEVTYHLDRQSVENKRILLVEDNDLNAEIAAELLTEEGLTVERAADGVVCIEKLEKAPDDYYSLILMDIQMPIMDGYKATQMIRKMSDTKKAQIPIVAMTANAFTEDREKALAVGMNDHVAKPIDMNTLIQVLEKQMGVKLQK